VAAGGGWTEIEKINVTPPLLVVQILARNQGATLGVVRDYIVRKLEADEELIRDVRASAAAAAAGLTGCARRTS
jgi:hypothetical protein